MALDATPSGAAANSYLTVAVAQAYFDGRRNADAWTSAATSAREQALVMATSRLDRVLWLGRKSQSTQRLEWPRAGVVDRAGVSYDSAVAPRPIQEATCEVALDLLVNGDPDTNDALAGVSSFSLGPLSLTTTGAGGGQDFPASVRRLCAGLAAAMGSTFRVMRA